MHLLKTTAPNWVQIAIWLETGTWHPHYANTAVPEICPGASFGRRPAWKGSDSL